MARRGRAGSTQVAVDAVMAAAKGVKVPQFVVLRDGDRPFWDAIVRARMANEWPEADLVHVANLARCMADIEANQALLNGEGHTVKNDRGTQIVNPRHALLETLSRRAMALTRLLQLHAAPRMGDLADQSVRKAEAMKANEVLDSAEVNPFLAKPIH